MKQQIFATAAAIAWFILLSWVYSLPCRNGETACNFEITAPDSPTTQGEAEGVDRQTQVKSFHALFDALLDC